jgi:hypothetical protein
LGSGVSFQGITIYVIFMGVKKINHLRIIRINIGRKCKQSLETENWFEFIFYLFQLWYHVNICSKNHFPESKNFSMQKGVIVEKSVGRMV